MSLLDLLSSQISPSTIGSLAQAIGASEGQTQSAVTAALPALVGAMANNTERPGGAESLLGALAGHSGGLLGSLAGAFASPSHSATGDGILGHVLGGQRGHVESAVAQSSGLDSSKIAALLPLLAPIVMSALAQKKTDGGLDAGGLTSLLTGDRARVEQHSPNLLTMLLDKNGDGNITGEAIQMGMGLLGNLFKN
jgi:hypothetical protein